MGLTVVGIGADGWEGLGAAARRAVEGADLLVGGERHLSLVPDTGAERLSWPSPMSGLLDRLPGLSAARRVCVLASGDPMLHGVGATLSARMPGAFEVIPHPSTVSLACARLGWPQAAVEVVSIVHRPPEVLHPAVQPGRRAVILTGAAGDLPAVAGLLAGRGYGPSRLVVLEGLGGPGERISEGTAERPPDGPATALYALAAEFRAEPGVAPLPRVPGLPDDAFEADGQLTKREVRALSVAALAPVPGALLWDVGAGGGSVGIEWMRVHPDCRAAAVERRPDRAERIRRNARALGVPGLAVVEGRAPAALEGLEPPDAVFIGGGLTEPGLLDACWAALPAGGRLVANAVTLEGEAVLAGRRAQLGGRLVRLEVADAEPLGGYTGWRPRRPVTQWATAKGAG